MSYDDRCLVDLINKRFDDTNGNIGELKKDMLREAQGLKKSLDEHVAFSAAKHNEFDKRLKSLEEVNKSMRWAVAGASAVAFALIEAVTWAFDKFIRPTF